MDKKLERVFRERHLTPAEAVADRETRQKLQQEFPPKSVETTHRGLQSSTETTSKADELKHLGQTIVEQWQDFFRKKGPGAGDLDTNAFMKELRTRALEVFGRDYSERPICGANRLTPDFYFPEEATIVEVAMSLRNPSSEFERDVLKAIMAQEAGNSVSRLVFLSKPGAIARSLQPGRQAVIEWARRAHGVSVEVFEFTPAAETVLEPVSETLNG